MIHSIKSRLNEILADLLYSFLIYNFFFLITLKPSKTFIDYSAAWEDYLRFFGKQGVLLGINGQIRIYGRTVIRGSINFQRKDRFKTL